MYLVWKNVFFEDQHFKNLLRVKSIKFANSKCKHGKKNPTFVVFRFEIFLFRCI